jgi:D-lactate dehydrogenase (cytochrome)
VGRNGGGGGWTTLRVWGFAAATGILTYSFASKQAGEKKLKAKEYSNPSKFSEPKYANIKSMEAVSIVQ